MAIGLRTVNDQKAEAMKLNYMECWNGAMGLLKDHKEAVLAIAGVFLFLPSVLLAQFVGEPNVEGLVDAEAIQAANLTFFAENWLAYLLMFIVTAIGSLSIYRLLSPSFAGTVSNALTQAAALAIFFIVANILIALLMFGGLFLFIVPGLYLIGRLAVVPMVIADENERNPAAALQKGWAITKNNGWSTFFFLLIILMVGLVTLLVFGLVIGLVLTLFSGGTGWPLAENILSNLLGTGFQILLLANVASVYRQLTGKGSDVAEIFS
ncbi:MAG: hypothetical protein AAGE37_08975 [Pseudomonadota bacterium]